METGKSVELISGDVVEVWPAAGMQRCKAFYIPFRAPS